MDKNIAIATAYYKAIGEKKMADVEKHLHLNVELISPMATVPGKQAVLGAIENFSAAVSNLNIRAKFASEDQAMLAYDVDFPAPIGKVRGAVLMTFKDNLISRIELFYDARPLERKKEEIFS